MKIKKSLIFGLLGFFVSASASANTKECSAIIFDKPTTYITGDELPATLPDGYFVYFSQNSKPDRSNSTIVELKGPNSTKTTVLKNLPDGKHYVRATAYNVFGDDTVESSYSNTASFFLTGGVCLPPVVPGKPMNLRLSSEAE